MLQLVTKQALNLYGFMCMMLLKRNVEKSIRSMDVTADDRKELERVRRQLEEVTAERDKLLAENRCLRRDCSISPQEPGKVSPSPASGRPNSSPVTGKQATGSLIVNNESPS